MQQSYKKIFAPFTVIILLLVSAFVWTAVLFPPKKEFSASFYDVGQGDAALIRMEGGEKVLVDGGPDKTVLTKLADSLPFYDRQIDVVVVTHPHLDHLNGLNFVLDRYTVKNLVMNESSHTTDEYLSFLKKVAEKKIKVTKGLKGTELSFSKGEKIKVLYPDSQGLDAENLNDQSIVLAVEKGDSRVLMLGDLEKDSQGRLLALFPDIKASVVKVPHHGSIDSFNPELWNKVDPSKAIISVGRGNKYGHPSSGVLEFLKAKGIRAERTDELGDIIFTP